jgi:hypothetical protein
MSLKSLFEQKSCDTFKGHSRGVTFCPCLFLKSGVLGKIREGKSRSVLKFRYIFTNRKRYQGKEN